MLATFNEQPKEHLCLFLPLETTNPAHEATHLTIDQRTQDQMIMVRQKLVAIELHLVNLQPLMQDSLESCVVSFLLENVCTKVATVQNVIQPSRFVNPRCPGHSTSLPQPYIKSKTPGPFDGSIVAPGRRTKVIDVITTLTDAEEYTTEEVAELYRFRWNSELDIRSIKESLNLGHVRCKSPEIVRRELWTTLLGIT